MFTCSPCKNLSFGNNFNASTHDSHLCLYLLCPNASHISVDCCSFLFLFFVGGTGLQKQICFVSYCFFFELFVAKVTCLIKGVLKIQHLKVKSKKNDN